MEVGKPAELGEYTNPSKAVDANEDGWDGWIVFAKAKNRWGSALYNTYISH